MSENSYISQAAKIVPDAAAILTSIVGFGLIYFFGKLILSAHDAKLGDYANALAVFVAAIAIGVSIWVQRRTQAFNESAAYLKNAVELMEKARLVLGTNSPPTNDRIAWVTAARLITRSQAIASKMSVPAHRLLYAAEHDYQRHKFGELLRWGGEPLSGAFFVGAKHLSESIGDAAMSPLRSKDGGDWIPRQIVATIYRFSQYPKGYADPLDGQASFSPSEIDRLWLFGERGVCDYINFRDSFFAVGKNIRRRWKDAPTSVTTGPEIDEVVRSLSGVSREGP